jgi:hypothetical protein
MICDYLKDLDSVKRSLKIVNNFKSGLIIHFLGSHKIELMVAKDIVYTLAFNQYVNNTGSVAKLLGVDRQNI